MGSRRQPRTADRFVVAVVTDSGRILVQEEAGPLAAPIDLLPKTVEVELQTPEPPAAGARLVVDPDGRIAEIYEGNNAVALP